MKIERLGTDKIRIFLTFDDLNERGIEKEDMWREMPKVHELFIEMMDQAYSEVGFEASGPLAVEVFSTPAQGMIVVVTRGRGLPTADEDYEADDVYEMELTLEQTDVISYAFRDFDLLIRAAKALQTHYAGGKLYHYQGL
jgi:adapter protein MecA 1/2